MVKIIQKRQEEGNEVMVVVSAMSGTTNDLVNKSKNIVIGFGITKKTIKSLKKADGLVVGSQLCKGITDSLKNRQNPVTNLNKMVKSLKRRIV